MENTSDPFKLDGPSELAERLIALGTQSINLSDEGLRTLANLAFQVSLKPEESRYPRFQIYVPHPQEIDSEGRYKFDLSMRFASPVPLDVSTLHRLSPGIPPSPYALLVQEIDSKLYTDGLTKIEDYGNDFPYIELQYPSSPTPKINDTLWGRIPGILLRIENPGALNLFHADSQTDLILREGQIKRTVDFSNTPIARIVYQEIASTIQEQVDSDADELLTLIKRVWTYIIGLAVEFGHGGAFVILPRDVSPDSVKVKDSLSIKHRTQGPELGAFIRSVIDSFHVDEKKKEARFWYDNLFDRARTVAQLSTTDGCVVLGHKFSVVGFGGEILVKDNNSLSDCVNLVSNPNNFIPEHSIDLKEFGTRHRSAARFCAQVPDAVVFVVSQDGEARQFRHLSKENVEICGPLRPIPGKSAPTPNLIHWL